ncbi:MAG TPA: glutaredoxin domain-containing protein [Polyangiaceae bacterium]|nr:glutaredoxin domain-containing protein [Polyangiaceae bacterium]
MSALPQTPSGYFPAWRVLRWLLLLACLWLTAAACDKEGEPQAGAADAGQAAKAAALPPLELRDGADKLLLTFVDEKGDFHVVQQLTEVPEAHRARVRVVVTDRAEGTGSSIYVADLTQKNPDGTYPVTVMSRAAWDEIGAERRKARLEALAPSDAGPAPSGEAPSSGSPSPGAARKPKPVVAVIYGAEWCKPCHDAARYLRSKGAQVIEKDVEESAGAQAELQRKLERAKMPPSASIPIIEINGQLLVGFSPRAIDRVLDAARAGKTL